MGTAVYLDAESSHNLLKNNEFHTVTGSEVLAIDSSSSNRIINNYFSALVQGRNIPLSKLRRTRAGPSHNPNRK
jgi:hypothetical protein